MEYLHRHKKWLKYLADILLWSLATLLAYLLRLEGEIQEHWGDIFLLSLLLLPFKVFFIAIFGHLRRSWQYSSVRDLLNLSYSLGTFTFVYFFAAFFIRNYLFLPLSVPLIEGMLAFMLLGGLRFVVRITFKEYFNNSIKSDKIKRVIIAGAGEAGAMIAREMTRHPESGLKPVAFLDDSVTKWNSKIRGIPVAGRTAEMKAISKKYNADELLIAMPSEDGKVIRRMVELAHESGLSHKIIPALHDLLSGKISVGQIREVDVEDLLRRDPVILDTAIIEKYVNGKSVLVTGAGGSIGSEIVRQLLQFKPSSITLLGRGENSIHQLWMELKEKNIGIPIHRKIADVRDKISLDLIFRETEPDVVYHAAAHKHVYLMEENESQAVLNNIIGTRNVTECCLDHEVKHFINISTDKAVNPTSVMGASKRIAEMIVQEASLKTRASNNFVSVRFGNVLGSRGSVIPIFKKQIQEGGPVTVTDPEMRRYFMTIPEASQLVLQAGAYKMNGALFILDMGEPVKILDMARDLIMLSGFEPDKDIKIKITGAKKGEKLYEELLTPKEGVDATQHEKIMTAKNEGCIKDLQDYVEKLEKAALKGQVQEIRSIFYQLIPTYQGNFERIEN